MTDLYVYKSENSAGGGLSSDQLSLTNFGRSAHHDAAGSMFKELRREEPVMIGRQVKHVWIGSDLKAINESFEHARKAAGMDEMIEASSSENSLKFQFTTSKAKLIDFVRDLDVQGLKLLSSQSPQPEQQTFFGDGEDKVVYKAEFVVVD